MTRSRCFVINFAREQRDSHDFKENARLREDDPKRRLNWTEENG